MSKPATRLTWYALLVVVAATAARAELPDPPDVDVEFAFVGDPLLGMEPGQPGDLWGTQPDATNGMASTTKSWAMYLVSRAVDLGILELDDTVTLSANALVPSCHGHSNLPGTTPDPGDQYELEDMLLATMIASSSEATNGISELLAAALDPGLLPGAPREEYFVELMNDEAADIGLVDTQFTNPYGGDHYHGGGFCDDMVGPTNAGPAPHFSTAREMAKWFAHGMEMSETFRQINAFRGQHAFQSLDNSNSHILGDWTPSYPGVEGQKPGGNASCSTCLVGQARRLGRAMSFGFMNSVDGSNTTRAALLDYAFQTVFHPEPFAVGPAWTPVVEHELLTVGTSRAVSAVLTDKYEVELLTWGIDAVDGTISRITKKGDCPERLDQILGGKGVKSPSSNGTHRRSQPGGRTITPGRGGSADDEPDDPRDPTGGSDDPRDPTGGSGDPTGGDGRGDDDDEDGTPGSRGGGPATGPGPGGVQAPWLPISLDAVHLGGGVIVVAVENPNGVMLSSWGLPECGPAFLRASQPAGAGTEPKLVRLADDRFALLTIRPGSSVTASVWELDPATGEIDEEPLDTDSDLRVIEEISAAGYEATEWEPAELMVAVVSTMGQVTLLGWEVEDDGTLVKRGDEYVGLGNKVELIAGAQSRELSESYALAYRDRDGEFVRLKRFRIQSPSNFPELASTFLPTHEIEDDGSIRLAAFEQDGLVLLTKRTRFWQQTRMVMFVTDDGLESWSTTEVQAGRGFPAAARLESGRAEGDFVIAQNDPADPHGALRLSIMRSAPRQ